MSDTRFTRLMDEATEAGATAGSTAATTDPETIDALAQASLLETQNRLAADGEPALDEQTEMAYLLAFRMAYLFHDALQERKPKKETHHDDRHALPPTRSGRHRRRRDSGDRGRDL